MEYEKKYSYRFYHCIHSLKGTDRLYKNFVINHAMCPIFYLHQLPIILHEKKRIAFQYQFKLKLFSSLWILTTNSNFILTCNDTFVQKILLLLPRYERANILSITGPEFRVALHGGWIVRQNKFLYIGMIERLYGSIVWSREPCNDVHYS